jgi:hypothetical protein
MVEYDVNEREMADLFELPRSKYLPHNARYYTPKKSKKNVIMIPISDLSLDESILELLSAIRKVLGSDYFDLSHITSTKILGLGTQLSKLFLEFMERREFEPITIIKETNVNETSPINPNRPSVIGLETVLIKQELRYSDAIYRPLDHPELIVLSIYFKYSHIPAIVAV